MTAIFEPVVIAVDVGGTSFKGALIDGSGHLRYGETASIRGLAGEEAYAHLATLCHRLRQVAIERDLRPLALGVITPGMDEVSGSVLFSSNLGWRGLPLRQRLEERLELPVAVGHDVRTAGLAEGLLGAGRGLADFAFVMIGTGIAAAFVTHGAVVAGARNMGGELGHAPVIADGEPCACGQLGCLEAYASGSGIARRYAALGGSAPLTAVEIAAAQGHDAIAAKVWGEAVNALALGLVSVTMMLDPGVIVLGGGLAEAGAVLLDPLRAAIERRLAWRTPPPILASMLGLAAGRIGAAMLAFRRAGEIADIEAWTSVDVLASFRAVA